MIIHKKHAGGVAGLIERLRAIGEKQVLIGIPSSEAAREGKINNAGLAAVHELGAPSRGIPARPFLVPTIKDNSGKYVMLMKQGFKAALSNKEEVAKVYEKIGIVASDDVKDYIVSGSFEPLKQKTIDKKGSSKPLISTGELRNSISYEVR